MRGMIRVLLGLVVLLGAVGYIERASDAQLLIGIMAAAVGLWLFSAGARAAQVYR